MQPYYSDEHVTLWHGDCLDTLASLPDASVDAVCTDPPYGLEFMGREWDSFGRDTGNGYREAPRINDRSGEGFPGHRGDAVNSYQAGTPFQAWCTEWATECLRVLKPGGHMVAFGGSRTWHRLASAVEDAGFEVRDSIAWLYGSGFPKSLDVSKAIDKAAGAERVPGRRLAPVTEERIAAAANMTPNRECLDCGKWTFSPDPCRCPKDGGPATPEAERWQGWGTALKPAFEPIVVARKPLVGTVAANVLTHGTGALNIDATRIEGRERTDYGLANATRTHGDVYSAPSASADFDATAGRWPTNVVLDESQAAELDRQSGESVSKAGGSSGTHFSAGGPGVPTPDRPRGGHNDSGGASRFFPTFRYQAKAPTSERPRAGEVAHPTVKPLDLMRWLVRLVTPPGGTVLEPFAGSGTTAEACVIEGFRCIAIEREADYLPLIVNRLSKPIQIGLDFGEAS